jgi:hypothetical protein
MELKAAFFALFFRHPEHGTASLPNQVLCVFDKLGKLLLYQDHCGVFKPLMVLKGQDPFLLTSDETGKGNGTHRLYMYKKSRFMNVLNTGDWDIHTIDMHEDENKYEPSYMNIKLVDINKDGYNDIRFSTTLVLYCGKAVKKTKLVYDFLFHPPSQSFDPAGDYNFDKNYGLCK